MGLTFYVTCCFSLAAFNILFLCLIFISLISIHLRVFLFGFILYGTLCTSWTWLTIYFSMLGEFSTIVSSKIFSCSFFFSSSSSSETPYNSYVGLRNIVAEVSETILSSFHSFYFILLFSSYFHHFIFQLTDILLLVFQFQ